MSTDTPNYSCKIDAYIYRYTGSVCKSPNDWIDLAIAALDQAGATLELQHKVEKLVRDSMEVPCE